MGRVPAGRRVAWWNVRPWFARPQASRHTHARACRANVNHPYPAILGLTDQHDALGRHAPARRAIELQAMGLVLDHVILSYHARLLETENVVVAQAPIARAMMINAAGRQHCEALVVLRQIGRGEIRIRGRIVAESVQPHLLDQPILLGAMVPLDPTFRLRARRPDDRDVELLAHAAKLRVRGVRIRSFSVGSRLYTFFQSV